MIPKTATPGTTAGDSLSSPTRHTPGPWHWCDGGRHHNGVVDDILIGPRLSSARADLDYGGHHEYGDVFDREVQADMMLIALAPELLAALQEANRARWSALCAATPAEERRACKRIAAAATATLAMLQRA